MAWNLSEEQQYDLMNAVEDVIKPYERLVKTTVKWQDSPEDEYRDLAIQVQDVAEAAPQEIKTLYRVYDSIISQGAILYDPEYVNQYDRWDDADNAD